MRIGIDARLYGLEHAGLGRYLMKLIETVLKYDKKNDYVLFLNKEHLAEFKDHKKVKTVEVNIPIYSLSEQLILPYIFAKEKLDLLHVPHFNAPIFYPGKYLLTIHDLIKHDSKGLETTTKNSWLYTIKRLGYHLLTSVVGQRALAVFVPSEFVKKDVVKRLKLPEDKVFVTYEAVSGSIRELAVDEKTKKNILAKYSLAQPFIIYTGSLYPHKNVNTLVEAVLKHNQTKEADLQLAIVCARSVFWERMNKKIEALKLENSIKLLGFVDDSTISILYSLALALVHPSKMEGFGLTGLEAMSVGLPVVSSHSSCLPEVYGDAALYFDPNSADDLTEKLEQLIKDSSLREELSEKGYLQSRKYSWEKMGKETLQVYKMVLKK